MATRARSAIAWGLVALAALPALLSVAPPWTMLQVQLAVLTKEESPLFLLFTLIVVIIVGAVARRHRLWMFGVLALTALVQYAPLAAADDLGIKFFYRRKIALWGDQNPTPVDERRIAYNAADGSPLGMLLFRGPQPGLRKTMVVIYGGAWRRGSPAQAIDVSRHFARHGWVVVAIDYRHTPAHPHPAQIDDVRRSFGVIADSAAAWGVDLNKVAVVGRSAGGHLALLAAYAPDSTRRLPIRAVVAFYAPYDLPASYDDRPKPDPIDVRHVLRDLIGGTPTEKPQPYHDASPSSYIRYGLPPTMLVYARHDHLVQAKFGRRAAAELSKAGSKDVYVELPWAEHGFDLLPGGLGSQIGITLLEQFFLETM